MLETGVLLLFLVPGLAAYASTFGLYSNGKTIAPEPPGANTVEAVIIIVGVSIIIHAVTASAFALDGMLCRGNCWFDAPAAWVDPYGSALKAVSGNGMSGAALSLVLIGVSAQGGAAYGAIRLWLRHLAKRDNLPGWIYGWAKPIADVLDNGDTAVIAFVLTTTDHGDKTLAYGGLIHDIALKPDGCVTRITLSECERYLVDLGSSATEASLSDALSRFSFMVIDGDNIRNIAFEALTFDQVA